MISIFWIAEHSFICKFYANEHIEANGNDPPTKHKRTAEPSVAYQKQRRNNSNVLVHLKLSREISRFLSKTKKTKCIYIYIVTLISAKLISIFIIVVIMLLLLLFNDEIKLRLINLAV